MTNYLIRFAWSEARKLVNALKQNFYFHEKIDKKLENLSSSDNIEILKINEIVVN